MGQQPLRVSGQFSGDGIRVEFDARGGKRRAARCDHGAPRSLVSKIAGTQSDTRDFVDICRADAVAGRADFRFAARALRRSVEFDVIRQNEVRQIRQPDARRVDSGRFEIVEFLDERCGRDDRARPDDTRFDSCHDSARHDAQFVGGLADSDRVTCICAAAVARNAIRRTREIVHDAALALITPLRADD